MSETEERCQKIEAIKMNFEERITRLEQTLVKKQPIELEFEKRSHLEDGEIAV